MNICFINFNKNWGGVKSWTVDYGKALQKRGHNITVVLRPETPFGAACVEAGFDVRAFYPGMKFNPVTIKKVKSILKEKKIDAAVVNISKDLNIGAVACRLAGVPVYHRIGLPQDVRNRLEDKLLHKLMTGIIVPSNGLRDSLASFYFIDASIINVLYNSKDASQYRLKEEIEEPVHLGVSSQLSGTKGHLYLLAAAKMLKDKGYRFILKIAGKGNQEAAIRQFIESEELGDCVQMCGFQTDIPAFLRGLDIFVLPSKTENFPNSLLEAMFAGLACVVTDVGATREMLADAGTIVAAKDTDALCNGIEPLLNDPELIKKYKVAARERALEIFDIEKNVVFLEKILSGRGAKR